MELKIQIIGDRKREMWKSAFFLSMDGGSGDGSDGVHGDVGPEADAARQEARATAAGVRLEGADSRPRLRWGGAQTQGARC